MKAPSFGVVYIATAICIITALVGGHTGMLGRFFVIAYFYISALFGAYMGFCMVKAKRKRLDPDLRKILSLSPISAFAIYTYIFLWPWTKMPLALDSFTQLAPGDRQAALVLRAILCLAATIIAFYVSRRILNWSNKQGQTADGEG